MGTIGGGINAFLISFLARVRGRELGIVRRQRTGALQRQSTSGGSTSRADWKKILNRFEETNTCCNIYKVVDQISVDAGYSGYTMRMEGNIQSCIL